MRIFTSKAIFLLTLSMALVLAVGCDYARKTISSLAPIRTISTIQFAPVINPTPITNLKTTVAKVQELEVVELTENNTVVLDQVFSNDSVSKVMLELQALSNKLKKNDIIYLVLNTPGGSVDAGNSLITFVKALPQNVKTISIFSASMGFQTAQNLGERLVLPNSTVMSHRAKFGVQGEAPGEMFSQLNYIMSIINGLDQVAAARMELSFDDYRKLVADEYWSYGANAVSEKSADRVILATCSKELYRTRKTNVETMFGSVEVEVSKCPLIPGMVSINAKSKMSNSELQYIKMMFENKKEFVNKFIVTNEYLKFQK